MSQGNANTLLERLATGAPLISDGATWTYLQQHGLESWQCPEEFNVTISGAMTGHHLAVFKLSWSFTHAAPFGFGEFTSTWTRLGLLSSSFRDTGDPETGTWSEQFLVRVTNDIGSSASGGVAFTAQVIGLPDSRTESVELVCNWQ
ncbi:MAG: hypothetical protein IIC27_04955 [Chloroflexi bacterium]|nr:hypothetical protein [Chloroflexota bacterium]